MNSRQKNSHRPNFVMPIYCMYFSGIINKKLNPNGIRIVQNNGVLQEVKHYHMHVLPNYAENNNKTLDEIFNLLTK